MVQEPAQARGLAVSALDDPCPSVIDLHPAHAPPAAHVPEDQNAVTEIAEVCCLEPERLPALGDIAEELADAAGRGVADGLAAHPYELHLEVRVAGGDHRLGVSRNRHHAEGAPDQLDVLPRHAPRIVSRARRFPTSSSAAPARWSRAR